MHFRYLLPLALAAFSRADEYRATGNVDLQLSSENAVIFGDQNPFDVLATLVDHCEEFTCESGSWTIQGNRYNGDDKAVQVVGITITVSVVDAQYKSGDKDILIQMLKDLANQGGINKKESHMITVCDDPTDGASCHDENLDQYTSSNTFDVATRDSAGALVDFIRVGVSSQDNDQDWSATMCNNLATTGTSLAGLWSGPGAAVGVAGFTLATLICSNI